MKQHEEPRRRRPSLRLRGYDYSWAGAYFVTICVQDRGRAFGEIVDARIRLNGSGSIAQGCWEGLPQRFANVELDVFVVMPDHLHGIILLHPVGAQFIAPPTLATASAGAINRAPTLGQIVRAFKAVTTRQIRLSENPDFEWQRNYYEHVIRNETSLDGAREYILNNPQPWEEDHDEGELPWGPHRQGPPS